jgi:hypothetical protein
MHTIPNLVLPQGISSKAKKDLKNHPAGGGFISREALNDTQHDGKPRRAIEFLGGVRGAAIPGVVA